MATPLSVTRLLSALKAEGCRIVEYRSWRTHNRNHKGAWGPVHGVMIHHTVTSGTNSSLGLCYSGRSDLPGPLCHVVAAKDGRLFLVGHGRANHAGSGDDEVLRAVAAEDYGSTPPRPNENNTDGNARFYGLEAINLGNGRDPWPEVQVDAIARWAAGICRAHGWSEKSVIAHKEWTNQKVDPRPSPGGADVAMTALRARVRTLLAAPAGADMPPVIKPEEPDMPLTDAEIERIAVRAAELVWTRDGFITNPLSPPSPNTHRSGGSAINGIEIVTRRVEDKVDGLSLLDLSPEQVTALAAQVASHPDLAEAIAERVAVKLANRLAE